MIRGKRTTKSSACTVAVAAFLTLFVAIPTSTAQEETEEELRRRLLLESYDNGLLPTDDRRNAALLYRQAFDLLASFNKEENGIIYSEDFDGGGSANQMAYQSQSVKDLLARSSEVMAITRDAANLEYAEFGLNRDDGFNTLLPHLTAMRKLGRLMNIHARVLRTNGQAEESAEILADALRMSRHASSDQVLIASLVGVACASRHFESIEDAVARGELDAAAAKIMLQGLDTDTPDPYQFANATIGEYDLLFESITGMDDPGVELGELLSWEGNEGPLVLAEYNRDELITAAEQLGPLHEQAAAAFLEPDPDKARLMVEELEGGIEAGTYGVLAQFLTPNLSTALNSKLSLDAKVEHFKKMLRAIASGEDPARFANAAIIYQTAFPYLRRIRQQDQEMLEMIRRVVAVTGTCEALPDSMLNNVRSILEESAPVIAMLRTAARFERCEWLEVEWAERRGKVIAEGEWVRPMRAAARLLMADAALALCTAQASGPDEKEQVTRSLADALAVILHMADGSHLFGEVVAAATLYELVELLETSLDSSVLDPDDAKRIEERFVRLDSIDPFGWKRAHEGTMRESLYDVIMSFGLDDPSAAERLARSWTIDRLAVLAFFEKSDKLGLNNHFTLNVEGPDRGDLFSVEDMLTINEEGLADLQTPHKRLFGLLAATDNTRPIAANTWRAASLESLARIEQALRNAKAKRTADTITP